MNWEDIIFNACSFVAALFLLEWAADKFVDHTVVVAKRLGVSTALVSLLTAGAEWEELAVVVASISQKKSNLALGNILGSSISNILGAFALGLLFYPGNATFDRSSKMYAALLLSITTLVAVFLAFYDSVQDIVGPFLIFLFVLYVLSIGYSIYRGAMSAPQDSDSDSDSSDSDSNSDDSDLESETTLNDHPGARHSYQKLMGERPSVEKQSRLSNNIQQLRDTPTNSRPSSPTKRKSKAPVRLNKRPKSLTYHCMRLILGFLALSVSCYVLSHSVSEVGDELGLSNSLVGITILSLATTLPEKFVAIISGSKGEGGIIIANTAGSNIFLLTLCAGVLFTCGDKADMAEGFQFAEIAVMWLSSAVLCACVFFGANRKIGAVIMGLYVAFLIAEFTVFSH